MALTRVIRCWWFLQTKLNLVWNFHDVDNGHQIFPNQSEFGLESASCKIPIFLSKPNWNWFGKFYIFLGCIFSKPNWIWFGKDTEWNVASLQHPPICRLTGRTVGGGRLTEQWTSSLLRLFVRTVTWYIEMYCLISRWGLFENDVIIILGVSSPPITLFMMAFLEVGDQLGPIIALSCQSLHSTVIKGRTPLEKKNGFFHFLKFTDTPYLRYRIFPHCWWENFSRFPYISMEMEDCKVCKMLDEGRET